MAIIMLKTKSDAAKFVDDGYAEYFDKASVDEIQGLLDAGKQTPTGKVIFDFVNKQNKNDYIFPIRSDSGMGSQYMPPEALGVGVVFFNLAVAKTGTVYSKPFPPVVQLYHELGHAKQYREWGKNKWDEVVKAGTAGFNGMISKGQPLSKLAQPYPMALESDNMFHHEFPLCNDLNCVKRSNYMDLQFPNI